jgi:hypothetical protein
MTIRSVQRTITVTLAVLCLASLTTAAVAKPKPAAAAAAPVPAKKKPIALAAFEGKKNADVRGWVRDVVQANFELTDAEDFKVKSDPASVAKMAKDLGVEGVVLGKLEKKSLTITAYDGADGRLLATIEIKQPPGPKLKNIITKKLPDKLLGAYGLQSPEALAKQQAAAKQEAEEAGAQDEGEEGEEGGEAKKTEEESGDNKAAASESESSPEESSPSGPVASPLELRGGLGFTKRNFTFHDTLNTLAPQVVPKRPLRDYNGGLDLSLWIRVDVYPAALLGGQGFMTNVGLTGGYEFVIPSTTVYKNNAGEQLNLKNYSQEWFIGARVRLPLPSNAGLAFVVTYGQHKYILKGDELFALVPDVAYGYLRPAAEFNMRFGKVTAEAALGARMVLSTGELERPDIWFRNVGGMGMDASLNLSYEISPKIAVFAGGRLIRYGFDFNPIDNNDPQWLAAGSVLAGGAVDQYLGGMIGASFRLPGSGGAQ